jgi:hypothetical protein
MTFTWGQLRTSAAIRFQPDDVHPFEKFFSVGEAVSARLFEGCGNIQLFRKGRVEL